MVGERIKKRREEKNLSLSELAKRVDISKGYLHSIENGNTQHPSAEILFNIANELGTTIADLLGEETHIPQDLQISDELKEFAEQAELTEEDVRMLAGIRHRGNQPKTAEDWQFLYEAIKRSIR